MSLNSLISTPVKAFHDCITLLPVHFLLTGQTRLIILTKDIAHRCFFTFLNNLKSIGFLADLCKALGNKQPNAGALKKENNTSE